MTIYLNASGRPAEKWFTYDVPAQDPWTGNIEAVAAEVRRGLARYDVEVVTSEPAGLHYPIIVAKSFHGAIGGESFPDVFFRNPPVDYARSYVYWDQLGNSPLYIGRAAVHEAGHGICGFFDAADWQGNYYPNRWMGNPYSGNPEWSYGEDQTWIRLAGLSGDENDDGTVGLADYTIAVRAGDVAGLTKVVRNFGNHR